MAKRRTRQQKIPPQIQEVQARLSAYERSMNLLIAASKAREQTKIKVEFKPPALMPGVLPPDTVAPIAMDEAMPVYQYANSYLRGEFSPFPGYPYLANLTTRAEYRQIAETLATEITREWISIKSKADDKVKEIADSSRIAELENAIKDFGLQGLVKKAAADDAYFGRAQIAVKIKGADDALPLVLSPKTVKQGSLEGFKTVEALWTTPLAYNAIDPTAPDFYKPTGWFMLGKPIHASRLLTIISRPVPDMLKPAYNFGGMSLSQLAEPTVENWLRTRQSVSDLINNFSITAIKTNMAQVLQGDCDGSDLFARIDLFTQTRSNRGVMALDMEAEELVQVNTPLSTLDALQAQALEHMCVVSRIPAMILTGISPSGLNASSDGEIRVFYDWIAACQMSTWHDPIDTMIKLIMLNLWGEIDDSIDFEFNPLWQLTAKEEAEIRRMDMETDRGYTDASVLSQEEVRERLSKNKDSGYSFIDAEAIPEPSEEEVMGALGSTFGASPDDDEDEFRTRRNTNPLRNDRPRIRTRGTSFDEHPAEDKSTSEAQRKAMQAAAHGESTLGIPVEVGKEFAKEDAK